MLGTLESFPDRFTMFTKFISACDDSNCSQTPSRWHLLAKNKDLNGLPI